jgi:opacity protein-like surface antigen
MTAQFVGLRAGAGFAQASRSARVAKRAKLGAMTLLFALGGLSGAQAQCLNTGNGFVGLSSGASSVVTSLVAATNTVNTAFLTQTSAFIGAANATGPDQTVGGVWSRAIAGEAEVKSTGTMNAQGTFTFPGVAPFTFNQNSTCSIKTEVPYGGYQAGIDLAKLNIGNSGTNVYFGVTAGYLGATGKNESTGNASSDFAAQFQVPFVGLYGAVVHGGFFADAMVLANFYQMQLSSFSNGLFDQGLNAHGWSATGNVGYHHDLGNNWFVEPSAGITWSRTTVDPLNVAGTLVLANNPGTVPPGTFQVNDIDSVLGRVGVRVGTSYTMGNLYLQPFATAALWHEFAGDVTANFNGNFNFFGLGFNSTGAFTVNRIGTFGQVGGGLAGSLLDTGWLAYGRVDLREGENITAVSFNAGVRYQFEAPKAAPAPGIFKAKAPPAPIIEAYNWTGFYAGGYVSTGWGNTDWNFTQFNTLTSPKMAGFLGGVEAGYNYQVGYTVFGVEADFAGVERTVLGGGDRGGGGLNGAASCPNGFFFTCNDALHALASLTGRIGFTWDRALFYVKGGGAWTENEFIAKCNTDSQPTIFATCAAADTPNTTAGDRRWGWTAGAGFEYGLSRHWSAKAEYDYYNFGNNTVTFTDGETVNIKETVNVVKIGVNYRWVPDVVVAKY